MLLWTRRKLTKPSPADRLTIEVAEDESFRHVVATSVVPISAEADWTCRVLVGGLKLARVYWYRFSESEGLGRRVGPRT
jgi:alkaline phosphatase D